MSMKISIGQKSDFPRRKIWWGVLKDSFVPQLPDVPNGTSKDLHKVCSPESILREPKIIKPSRLSVPSDLQITPAGYRERTGEEKVVFVFQNPVVAENALRTTFNDLVLPGHQVFGI